jgi:hypothetical protein
MYHIFEHSMTVHFTYRMYLWVSYDSLNDEYFLKQHKLIYVCNKDATGFFAVGIVSEIFFRRVSSLNYYTPSDHDTEPKTKSFLTISRNGI